MKFTKEDSLKTKGVAVILLLFHHLFFTDRGYPVETFLISMDTLNTLAVAARICVWIFCFVSAYGITLQFYRKPEEQSIGKFVVNRWLSLMKGYWFAFVLVFLCLALEGRAPMQTYKNSVWNLLLDGFAWADFFGTPTLVGAWWYMCFAQMQVLMLPVLILFLKRVGGIVGFAAIFLGSQYLGNAITSPSGGNYLMYLSATVVGILCVQYDFFGKIKELSGFKGFLRWLVVLGAVIGCICLRFALVAEDFPYKARQINYIAYTVAAVGVALLTSLLKYKSFGWLGKTMAFLGKHSGNIFLIHMLWVRYFQKQIFSAKNVWLILAFVLALSCVTSLLMEWLKKLVRYNQWFTVFTCKQENKVLSGENAKV